MHRDIDIAVRLGAKVIRAIINTPPEVMEGAAPYAEEQGVRLLLEVHAPFHYEHPWILEHLEVMHRTRSPALGLMPDMGTFVEAVPAGGQRAGAARRARTRSSSTTSSGPTTTTATPTP